MAAEYNPWAALTADLRSIVAQMVREEARNEAREAVRKGAQDAVRDAVQKAVEEAVRVQMDIVRQELGLPKRTAFYDFVGLPEPKNEGDK
jgi:hypothetical protein